MGTHRNTDSTESVQYTANGNRLYRFKRVSSDELQRNRIPSYEYVV